VRSTNNPLADYAEGLASRALRFKLARRSKAGYDGEDDDGVRYEVKARRRTAQNRSAKLSFMRGLDKGHFHFLVGILFHEDFSIERARLLPIEAVREVAKFHESVNAWDMHLRPSIWERPGAKDITDLIQSAVTEEGSTGPEIP